MRTPSPPVFDTPLRIAYINLLFNAGTISSLITPAILTGWQDRFHWTQSQLGLLAGVELLAMAASASSAFYWQKRWSWRLVSLAGFGLAGSANLLCVGLNGFFAVCVARSLAGVAGGLLAGVNSAFYANTRHPDKNIAISTLSQVLAQSVLFYFAAFVLSRWGLNGIYVMMALNSIVLIPFLRCLPPSWPTGMEAAEAGAPPSVRSNRTAAFSFLFAFLPFSIFQGGVFAFLGHFGAVAARLSDGQTLHALGLSTLLSLAGPCAAFLLSVRKGIGAPLVGAIAVLLMSMVALTIGRYSELHFIVTISILQIAWTFTLPYLYAALIAADNSLTFAAIPVAAVSFAIGASLVGATIERYGLSGVLWLSIVCLGLTALCTLPHLLRSARSSRNALILP